MDYLYSELNKEIAIDPYGGCYCYLSYDIENEITDDWYYQPLHESFSTEGQEVRYNTEDSYYEYFAYPKPYGELKSITREGTEELEDWLEEATSEVVGSPISIKDKYNTIYYLYRTFHTPGSESTGESKVIFKV